MASHITVRQGDAVLVDDVSLQIRPLELHGLVGPIGAGKTTLLEAIAGLVPCLGDVVLGHVPIDREQRRQHIFLLPDEHALFLDDRAQDLLQLAARSLGTQANVQDVVERLALGPLLPRRLSTLGQGERRRVLLAMALLVPRGFVLLDEPFAGLGVKEARALANVLRTSTNEDRALLCALHAWSDAERLCDRFTLLDGGRVVAAGPLHELRARANVHPGASLEEVFLALA